MEYLSQIIDGEFPNQELVNVCKMSCSHEVYRCEFDTETFYVKIEPSGAMAIKTFDVNKEALTLSRLGELGVSVPVPVAVGKMAGRRYFITREIVGEPVPSGEESARLCGNLLAELHSTPVDWFDHLPRCASQQVIDLVEHASRIISPDSLTKRLMAYLRENKPEECFVLNNGDFGLGELLQSGTIYVLDWDRAFIGDPAWDVWWAVKGGVSYQSFGCNPQIFVEAYQKRKSLKNTEYFRIAALGYSYVYGRYVLQHGADHPQRVAIRTNRPKFISELEKAL